MKFEDIIIKETIVDPEAINLPKWRKNTTGFPEGMEAELIRLGKKKNDKEEI